MGDLSKRNVLSAFFRKRFNFLVFVILAGLWIPLVFLNFDPHHDGLILTTIRLTERAIVEGGQYPFNQYGPSWMLPFLLVGSFVSDDYLFLALRLITVFLYLFSSFLLIRVSRFFMPSNKAWVPGALFLSAQPFVSDIGSDLVPWPSAIAMPLVILSLYFSIKSLKGAATMSLFWVGFLTPLILLSRLQIGLLTGISILVLLIFHRNYRSLFSAILGFCISGFLLIATLIKLNWFESAVYDQIIFGLTYLSADKSTFPKPVVTFFGTLLVVALLQFTPKIFMLYSQINKFFKVFAVAIGLSCMLLISFTLIYRRDLSPSHLVVVATRRFWIIAIIGCLIFFFMKLLWGSIKLSKLRSSWFLENQQSVLLLLFAVSLQSQTYPLFDQMHFWWGSPLSFLVATLVIRDLSKKIVLPDKMFQLLRFVFCAIVGLSLLVPWLDQVTKEKYEYPKEIGSKIYSSNIASSEQRELQQFFLNNMAVGSRVLNLCDDTNVFFGASRFITASRFFVFWGEQMSHADQIFIDMKSSNPDYIVTCDLIHAPALRSKQELTRSLLIQSLPFKITPIETFVGHEGRRWDIFQQIK